MKITKLIYEQDLNQLEMPTKEIQTKLNNLTAYSF